MTQIYISNLRLRAFHGVLPQEGVVGGDYLLNVTMDYPFQKACLTDDVADTMNYAEAVEVIKLQMQQPSHLLEHAAHRIAVALLERFPLAEGVVIDLRKLSPPMSADCDGAGVRLSLSKSELKNKY